MCHRDDSNRCTVLVRMRVSFPLFFSPVCDENLHYGALVLSVIMRMCVFVCACPEVSPQAGTDLLTK